MRGLCWVGRAVCHKASHRCTGRCTIQNSWLSNAVSVRGDQRICLSGFVCGFGALGGRLCGQTLYSILSPITHFSVVSSLEVEVVVIITGVGVQVHI